MLSLTDAENLIDLAIAEATKIGRVVSVAVVDPAGYLIALKRMEGSGFLTPQIAEAKGFSAAAWGTPTLVIAERARARPETFQAFTNIGRTKLIPGHGGYPIKRGDVLVAGFGVSGGSGEEDEAICQGALAKFDR